jgi:hypothetical protein
MEPKVIIWIIGIILYFWIKSRKASSSQSPEENIPRPTNPTSAGPVTFEDLLREIQSSRKPEREPAPTPAPAKPFESYEEVSEESFRETIPETEYSRDSFSTSETYKSYEKAKSEAFQRASLEDTLKLENTDIKFLKFSEYQATKEPTVAEQISTEFRDPDTLKKYFIVNEVLNRKWT